jgi:hypothetical protein
MIGFLAPVHTTNRLPAFVAQRIGEAQVVEQHLFPINHGLKDNIIKIESTNTNNPTKRLDKIDDATGRIIYNIATLEIKHNITKEVDNRIGHLHIKDKLFTKRELKFTSGPLDGSTDLGQLSHFTDPDALTAHTQPWLLVQSTDPSGLAHSQPPVFTGAFLPHTSSSIG